MKSELNTQFDARSLFVWGGPRMFSCASKQERKVSGRRFMQVIRQCVVNLEEFDSSSDVQIETLNKFQTRVLTSLKSLPKEQMMLIVKAYQPLGELYALTLFATQAKLQGSEFMRCHSFQSANETLVMVGFVYLADILYRFLTSLNQVLEERGLDRINEEQFGEAGGQLAYAEGKEPLKDSAIKFVVEFERRKRRTYLGDLRRSSSQFIEANLLCKASAVFANQSDAKQAYNHFKAAYTRFLLGSDTDITGQAAQLDKLDGLLSKYVTCLDIRKIESLGEQPYIHPEFMWSDGPRASNYLDERELYVAEVEAREQIRQIQKQVKVQARPARSLVGITNRR